MSHEDNAQETVREASDHAECAADEIDAIAWGCDISYRAHALRHLALAIEKISIAMSLLLDEDHEE